jgi:hypothetical protein
MSDTHTKAALLVGVLVEGFKEARAAFIAQGYPAEVVDNLLADFKEARDHRRLGPGENDIDRYDSLEQVQQALARAAQKVTAKVKREKLQAARRSAGVQVKNDAKAHVAIPQNWEDAKLLGLGTRWCVSMAKTEVHWNHYARSTHYMATIKGKPSPWIENHPELGPDERPKSEHVVWKVGLDNGVDEVGDGETAGGPGRYAIVPDILYKVVYTTPPTNETRNSADKLMSLGVFLKLTGMSFNDFGKHAWVVAEKAGITALDFMRQATPEIWREMGQRVPMRHQWMAEAPECANLPESEKAAAWEHYWVEELPNDTFDPSDPGDKEILAALHAQFSQTV